MIARQYSETPGSLISRVPLTDKRKILKVKRFPDDIENFYRKAEGVLFYEGVVLSLDKIYR